MTRNPQLSARRIAVVALAATAFAAVLGACSSDPATGGPAGSTLDTIARVDLLDVECGKELVAHGAGAAPDEVVTIHIVEQVPNGIDIASESVADHRGEFTMNEWCDPTDPHAEVPARWTFVGRTSGRTGETLVRYHLAAG